MPKDHAQESNFTGTEANSKLPETSLPIDGPPLKPCCACPETRRARDNCVLLRGEEYCTEFIKAHQECLRAYGFIID